ncbi:DNA/RNA nuclease SfsA [Chloroflexota bacterium]
MSGLHKAVVRTGDNAREAIFLSREGRFTALVELEGKGHLVYLPNSGRMTGLLLPGQSVVLVPRQRGRRITDYDLVAVSSGSSWAWVDSRTSNELIAAALSVSALTPFCLYSRVRREIPFEGSRFDFCLGGGPSTCLLEVKSVTLVEEGKALFPDAPTRRGRRHLDTLAIARSGGYEAAVVFVIQRDDAANFSPHDGLDPAFGRALRAAAEAGVGAYAYGCDVTRSEIKLAREVEVCL